MLNKGISLITAATAVFMALRTASQYSQGAGGTLWQALIGELAWLALTWIALMVYVKLDQKNKNGRR